MRASWDTCLGSRGRQEAAPAGPAPPRPPRTRTPAWHCLQAPVPQTSSRVHSCQAPWSLTQGNWGAEPRLRRTGGRERKVWRRCPCQCYSLTCPAPEARTLRARLLSRSVCVDFRPSGSRLPNRPNRPISMTGEETTQAAPRPWGPLSTPLEPLLGKGPRD